MICHCGYARLIVYIYSLDIAAAIIGDAANANVASSVYHLVGCVP